jgi:two-component system sensor histidine kinase KdpD
LVQNLTKLRRRQEATVSDDVTQPNPEHFLTLIRQQQRGRHKVYVGFAAGVGKTYQMLQEAHRLQRQGVDVVVGIVETHGRAETAALVEGLEQVPQNRIEYRGVVLEEMNLDALLSRHPTVALVDELAHNNAPGSRHEKRYQDVDELLQAGINVISTLNVQHLESLYDIVEQATGIKVTERLPDHVLGMADQIVNVDVSAEDLRERLAEGKIYPPERVERALDNFFTLVNLSRLRELTLEEIAHHLDRRHQEEACGVKRVGLDRVMVCLSSGSPNPASLVRKGSRLADRLNATWYAVYIGTPKEPLERIDAATQRQISNTLALAQQLDGVPMTVKGSDVVSTIAAFVKEYAITHVVLARNKLLWYRRWFGKSVLDRLLQTVRGVGVVIEETDEDAS